VVQPIETLSPVSHYDTTQDFFSCGPPSCHFERTLPRTEVDGAAEEQCAIAAHIATGVVCHLSSFLWLSGDGYWLWAITFYVRQSGTLEMLAEVVVEQNSWANIRQKKL
jgi:hypothetical protein